MVGASFYYIGYPIRAKTANPVSCDIGLGVSVTGFLSNTSATALYAITASVPVYKVWAEEDEVVCFGDIHCHFLDSVCHTWLSFCH